MMAGPGSWYLVAAAIATDSDWFDNSGIWQTLSPAKEPQETFSVVPHPNL